MPDKYKESVEANANELTDPAIAKLYARIRLITRGPIFAPGRVRAIIAMNVL